MTADQWTADFLALARRAAVLAAAAIVVGLPAPARSQQQSSPDDAPSRTCRSIIMVINPASTTIDITSTLRIGEANAVAISYIARPDSGLPRPRKIVCSFEDRGGAYRRSRELVGVTSDGMPLGPARLRFINRFWIGSREAEAAAAALSPRRQR